jgi:hypothetical protein
MTRQTCSLAKPSKRHEVWYFAQTKLGALRMDNYKYQFIEQPEGWIGPVVHPNMPILTNLVTTRSSA